MRDGLQLATLAMLSLSWASPSGAAQSPPGITTIVVSSDSTLTGTWRSAAERATLAFSADLDRRPTARLLIADRLEANGVFDGLAYPGTVRSYPTAGAELSTGPAVIRIVRIDSTRILVRLEESRTAAPAWSATFTRDASRARAALPNFGEYVYVETLPQALHRERPAYPESARRKGISGTVIVQALVDRLGRVRDTRVIESIRELDATAMTAVRKWRFKPASAKGEPVSVWVAVPVKFSFR